MAKNYLGVDSHPLFEDIRVLLEEIEITPADGADNLMLKSEDADVEICLKALIDALMAAEEKTRLKVEEEAPLKAQLHRSDPKAMKPIHNQAQTRNPFHSDPDSSQIRICRYFCVFILVSSRREQLDPSRDERLAQSRPSISIVLARSQPSIWVLGGTLSAIDEEGQREKRCYKIKRF